MNIPTAPFLSLQDDVSGKCEVRYAIKSRHLSGRPKVLYKTRNMSECSDRSQTDIGIHVHSYEAKVRLRRCENIRKQIGWCSVFQTLTASLFSLEY